METSYVNKITGFVVALVLGAILVGGMLAPTVAGIQETVGDNVTYTNNIMSTNQYRYDYVDGLTLVATASETEGIQYDYVVNGQAITLISDYMIAVLSDGYSMQIGSGGQFSCTIPSNPFVTSPTLSPSTYPIVTLTMNNGEWVLMGGDTEIASGNYSWLVTYVDNGKYVAHNGSVTGAYCHKNPNDFIVYGSTYTSGELDTYYAFGNGVMNWAVSDYTVTLNWSASKVDGTTDIYKVTTCNITVTDGENTESFTPYRCLYLYEVEGHKTTGPAYAMFGVITLLAIVMLVVVAANAVKGKYN